MTDGNIYELFEIHFPICKIMRIHNILYIYDGKSGLLAETDENQLRDIYNYRIHNNSDIPKYLKTLLSNGCFLSGKLIKIVPNNNETKYLAKNEIQEYFPRKLCLEITEECTLRCKYCFYTNENPHKRKHSNVKMDESIAFKAIDYYYDKYTEALTKVKLEDRYEMIKTVPPHIAWWGGEPFTNFDLIVKTKQYIESLDWGKYGVAISDITYNVATNLTILNDSIIKFLTENNVNLLISLDGNKAQHNMNRIYKDGTGSFDVVIHNIQTLINRHPDYCKKNIILQPVLADNIDTNEALTFIDNFFDLKRSSQKILSSLPSGQRNEGAFLTQLDFLYESYDFYINRLRLQLAKLAQEADLENILRLDRRLYREFAEFFLLEKSLSFDNPHGTNSHCRSYSCPLAVDTIFISTNGNIHCCSKVDQTFPVGNVSTGIDNDALYKVYRSYFREIDKNCKSCWAFNFCKICPAMVYSNGVPILPSKNECEHIRKRIELLIMGYIIIVSEFECLYDRLQSIFDSKEHNVKFDSKPTLIKSKS